MEPFDERKNLLYYKIESNIKHWTALDRIGPHWTAPQKYASARPAPPRGPRGTAGKARTAPISTTY